MLDLPLATLAGQLSPVLYDDPQDWPVPRTLRFVWRLVEIISRVATGLAARRHANGHQSGPGRLQTSGVRP